MIKILKNIYYSEKGAVAILSFVMIGALALVISLAFLELGRDDIQILRYYVNGKKSFFSAEAGLEDSLLRYKKEGENIFPTATTTFVGAEYNSELSTSTLDITITTQGSYENTNKSLQVVCINESWDCIFLNE